MWKAACHLADSHRPGRDSLRQVYPVGRREAGVLGQGGGSLGTKDWAAVCVGRGIWDCPQQLRL